MKISKLVESGCSNVLRWAISNGANVKDDVPLQSIVNDDLFYLLTIEDVNFFELFKLTQLYREKLRIIQEFKAAVPSMEELTQTFNGTYIPDENEPDRKSNIAEVAEHVIQNFINIALQMSNDDDIIKPSAVRLFLPMISRRFTIQIPVSFVDLMDSISEDEAGKLFTTDYPSTLQEIIDTENHGFKVKFYLAFIQATWITKYDARYDQYLKITKYSPLKNSNVDPTKIFKHGLLGFYKYNNITRGQVKCNLFNPGDNATLESTISQIGNLKTPLQVEFAIELPIQYMQILENAFSRDELNIAYESSMSNIIDSGIRYDDFVIPEKPADESNEEANINYENVINNVNAYKVRIAEANQVTLNAITMLLNNEGDIDIRSAFALLPSIYTTRAVITINTECIDKYMRDIDPVINEMFAGMIEDINGILADINRK